MVWRYWPTTTFERLSEDAYIDYKGGYRYDGDYLGSDLFYSPAPIIGREDMMRCQYDDIGVERSGGCDGSEAIGVFPEVEVTWRVTRGCDQGGFCCDYDNQKPINEFPNIHGCLPTSSDCLRDTECSYQNMEHHDTHGPKYYAYSLVDNEPHLTHDKMMHYANKSLNWCIKECYGMGCYATDPYFMLENRYGMGDLPPYTPIENLHPWCAQSFYWSKNQVGNDAWDKSLPFWAEKFPYTKEMPRRAYDGSYKFADISQNERIPDRGRIQLNMPMKTPMYWTKYNPALYIGNRWKTIESSCNVPIQGVGETRPDGNVILTEDEVRGALDVLPPDALRVCIMHLEFANGCRKACEENPDCSYFLVRAVPTKWDQGPCPTQEFGGFKMGGGELTRECIEERSLPFRNRKDSKAYDSFWKPWDSWPSFYNTGTHLHEGDCILKLFQNINQQLQILRPPMGVDRFNWTEMDEGFDLAEHDYAPWRSPAVNRVCDPLRWHNMGAGHVDPEASRVPTFRDTQTRTNLEFAEHYDMKDVHQGPVFWTPPLDDHCKYYDDRVWINWDLDPNHYGGEQLFDTSDMLEIQNVRGKIALAASSPWTAKDESEYDNENQTRQGEPKRPDVDGGMRMSSVRPLPRSLFAKKDPLCRWDECVYWDLEDRPHHADSITEHSQHIYVEGSSSNIDVNNVPYHHLGPNARFPSCGHNRISLHLRTSSMEFRQLFRGKSYHCRSINSQIYPPLLDFELLLNKNSNSTRNYKNRTNISFSRTNSLERLFESNLSPRRVDKTFGSGSAQSFIGIGNDWQNFYWPALHWSTGHPGWDFSVKNRDRPTGWEDWGAHSRKQMIQESLLTRYQVDANEGGRGVYSIPDEELESHELLGTFVTPRWRFFYDGITSLESGWKQFYDYDEEGNNRAPMAQDALRNEALLAAGSKDVVFEGWKSIFQKMDPSLYWYMSNKEEDKGKFERLMPHWNSQSSRRSYHGRKEENNWWDTDDVNFFTCQCEMLTCGNDRDMCMTAIADLKKCNYDTIFDRDEEGKVVFDLARHNKFRHECKQNPLIASMFSETFFEKSAMCNWDEADGQGKVHPKEKPKLMPGVDPQSLPPLEPKYSVDTGALASEDYHFSGCMRPIDWVHHYLVTGTENWNDVDTCDVEYPFHGIEGCVYLSSQYTWGITRSHYYIPSLQELRENWQNDDSWNSDNWDKMEDIELPADIHHSYFRSTSDFATVRRYKNAEHKPQLDNMSEADFYIYEYLYWSTSLTSTSTTSTTPWIYTEPPIGGGGDGENWYGISTTSTTTAGPMHNNPSMSSATCPASATKNYEYPSAFSFSKSIPGSVISDFISIHGGECCSDGLSDGGLCCPDAEIKLSLDVEYLHSARDNFGGSPSNRGEGDIIRRGAIIGVDIEISGMESWTEGEPAVGETPEFQQIPDYMVMPWEIGVFVDWEGDGSFSEHGDIATFRTVVVHELLAKSYVFEAPLPDGVEYSDTTWVRAFVRAPWDPDYSGEIHSAKVIEPRSVIPPVLNDDDKVPPTMTKSVGYTYYGAVSDQLLLIPAGRAFHIERDAKC